MVQHNVLEKLLPSVQFMRLDGGVEATKRQEIVNKFNSDPSYDVLLLTTSVGGLGLNLTGADTVIFVEHDWNPQKDIQAMDRAHRIGQKKVVNVYRIVTRGTLEEKILKYVSISHSSSPSPNGHACILMATAVYNVSKSMSPPLLSTNKMPVWAPCRRTRFLTCSTSRLILMIPLPYHRHPTMRKTMVPVLMKTMQLMPRVRYGRRARRDSWMTWESCGTKGSMKRNLTWMDFWAR